ncbi:MAG: winged helix-turn-helix transcriptional regulator [Gemmatimonas sp.]
MRSAQTTASECPVARSLDEVGDTWRMLILRDALVGFRRFDEFEQNLGIAPNILAQRLGALVRDGLLEKRPYQQRPVRYEYVPTPKAREFAVVLAALVAWGTRWLSPEGAHVTLVDVTSGETVTPVIRGRDTGRECELHNMKFAPGPQAGAEILGRVERLRLRRTKQI